MGGFAAQLPSPPVPLYEGVQQRACVAAPTVRRVHRHLPRGRAGRVGLSQPWATDECSPCW